MADKILLSEKNHKVLYEGRYYKLIQLLDSKEFVLNDDGIEYDCLFVFVHDINKKIAAFRYLNNSSIEVVSEYFGGVKLYKNIKRLIKELPKIRNNSFYSQPDVGKCKIVYKSNRYKIIKMRDDEKFDSTDKSTCDYLFFDCKYGAVTAFIDENEDGTLSVGTMTQNCHKKTFKDINDLAINAPSWIHTAYYF